MESNPQSLPPALVAFLQSSGRKPEEILTRCLFALAADGWLRIDAPGSGAPAMVRIERLPERSSIRVFEGVALDRVVRMTGSLGQAPLTALTDFASADDVPWRRSFLRAVAEEGIGAGLISRGVRDLVALSAALGLGVACAIALAAAGVVAPSSALKIGFAAFVVITIVIKMLWGPKLTAEGRAAVEWWRRNADSPRGAVVEDRRPAQTPGDGLAPLPPDQLWSSYGGQWRTIKIGSADMPSRGRPKRAVTLVVVGAASVYPLLVLGDSLGGVYSRPLPYVGPAIAGAVLLFSWLPGFIRGLSVPSHQEITGQVVKRWTYQEEGADDKTKTRFCCCVDDGTSAEGWSFRISKAQYKQIHTGDIVSVSFNPRWHKVRAIKAVQVV